MPDEDLQAVARAELELQAAARRWVEVSSVAGVPPRPDAVSRLHEAVTAAHNSGASAATVDLPTGDDLLRLLAGATTVAPLAPTCFIDDCGKTATLVVESHPDDIFLCDDHRSLYSPQPWDRVVAGSSPAGDPAHTENREL